MVLRLQTSRGTRWNPNLDGEKKYYVSPEGTFSVADAVGGWVEREKEGKMSYRQEALGFRDVSLENPSNSVESPVGRREC